MEGVNNKEDGLCRKLLDVFVVPGGTCKQFIKNTRSDKNIFERLPEILQGGKDFIKDRVYSLALGCDMGKTLVVVGALAIDAHIYGGKLGEYSTQIF